MKCSKCRNYSRGLRRCKLGKALPKTFKDAVEVVQLMGISYLCSYHPQFEKVIAHLTTIKTFEKGD